MIAKLEELKGTCRSCGAEVYWATNHRGNRQCVAAKPEENGNLLLNVEKGPDGVYVRATYVGPPDVAPALFGDGGPRYVDHHANCPQAKQWKKQ